MSGPPWDTGLSVPVILAVEAAASAYTGISLAETEAATPTTATVTAAEVEATPQFGQAAPAGTSPPPSGNTFTQTGADPTSALEQNTSNVSCRRLGGVAIPLQFEAIAFIWGVGGGASHLQDTMAAIALAESGGVPDVINDCPPTGDYSVGLWQINYYGDLLPGRTAEYGAPAALQYSLSGQVKAAISLAGDGSGLSNWSTYNNGAYLNYLGGAVGTVPGGGGLDVPTRPTVTLPQGVPHPPRYISSFVDGLISDIPNIPIVGSAVKAGLRDVFDPVASGIDAMLDWSVGALNDIWNDVTAGFGQIESGVESAFNAAKSFASTVGQEVLHDAENLYNEAIDALDDGIHLAEGAISAVTGTVEDFATTVGQEVLHDAESLFNTVESDIESVAKSVSDVAGTVGQEVLHDAESLFNQAVGLIDAGVQAAESFATQAADDVRQWATDLINDAEGLASTALTALETDVIAPIFDEVEHIAKDILGPAESALTVIGKVVDWLTWLAEWPFTIPTTIIGILESTTPRALALRLVENFNADNGEFVRAIAARVQQ